MGKGNVAEIRVATMERYEAEQKTGRIRSNIEENRRLIKEVHDRRGWEALGYNSFDEWGSCELKLSRPHLYHLLGAGKIEEHINGDLSSREDKQPLIGVPEKILRPLGTLLERKDATSDEQQEARSKIIEAWDIANERSNGKPTGKAVAEAVDIVLGRGRPMVGQASFLDDEDDDDEDEPVKPPPKPAATPLRNEAGEAWIKMLTDFSTYYTSIQSGGGIGRVSRYWTAERKRGYVERCREIRDLFDRMATELEGEIG